MNKFLEALTTILVVVVALVAADQITGALERARVRRNAAKTVADAAASGAAGDQSMRVAA